MPPAESLNITRNTFHKVEWKRHSMHHLSSSIFSTVPAPSKLWRACAPQVSSKYREQWPPLKMIWLSMWWWCLSPQCTVKDCSHTTWLDSITRHDQKRALLLFWRSEWSPALPAALPDTFKMEGEMSGSPTLESPIHQTIVTGSGGPTAAQAIWNGTLGDTDTSSGSTVK